MDSIMIKCARNKALAPVILILVLLAPVAFAEQTDVRIGIHREGSALLEVAVPHMFYSGKDTEELGAEAAEIINYDLKFTSYFKPNENYRFMRQATMKDLKSGKINYDEWKTLASNFLVKGSVKTVGGGKLALEAKVYDIQAKESLFAKRYTGPRKLFRQMAHQFADDFLLRLIGETGVARTKVTFVSRVKGRKELFIMDYDGHKPRKITSDRSIVMSPDWNHAKKNLILFTTYRYRNPDLYAIDLTAKKRYPISTKIGLNSTGEWSPDGTKVAYSLSRRGNSDIYVSNADGSNPRKLTSSRSIETSPTWSPDGKRLAFTSDKSGSPQIYIMSSNGGAQRRLTYKGGYSDGATWSTKGDMIAYTSRLGRSFHIVTSNANDGRSSEQLTFGGGSNESPSWSPNGNHIIFTSTKTGKPQLYTMNADGSGRKMLRDLPGGGYLPSWGPD